MTERTWHPIAMTEAEAWVAATPHVGWIDQRTLRARETVAAEVERLQGERDALEATIAAAREAGRQEGREAGLRELAGWLQRAQRASEAQAARLRAQVVDAALVVAEVVLREAISADRATIGRLLDGVLAGDHLAPMRVRVAPSDLDAAQGHLTTVEVQPDPTMRTGDVVVEFMDGQIDARLETVLEAFRGPLSEELGDG